MDSILTQERKSKNVLIVFSARDTARGKFTFFKMVEKIDANIIFINDFSNQWYLKGTPDFINKEHFISYIGNHIHRLKADDGELFTLGSSMGAHAALHYGSIFEANKIIAMGPEAELMMPLGRSISSLTELPNDVCDISKATYKYPKKVFIVSGNNDIPDFYSACKIKHFNPNVNVTLINNRTHVVAKYINAQFGIENFLIEIFNKNEEFILNNFESGTLTDYKTACSIKTFNEELSCNKVALSNIDDILSAAKNIKNWSMIQFFAARILYEINQHNLSLQYLNDAITAQPSLGRALYLRTKILYESGYNISKANDSISQLLQVSNTFSAYEIAVKIKIKIKSFDEALILLEKMIHMELNENQKSFVEKNLKLIKTKIRLEELIFKEKEYYKYITDIDLNIKNYKNNEVPDVQIKDSNITKNSKFNIVYRKKLHHSANIKIKYRNAINNTIFIDDDVMGDLDITISGENSILYIGKNCSFHGCHILVNGGETITLIGQHVTTMENVVIQNGNSKKPGEILSLIIGDDSMIAGSVFITSTDEHPIFHNDNPEEIINYNKNDLVIEPHVWIGHGAKILKDVTIGSCSVVAAASIVTNDIPKESMVCGVPAKIIKRNINWARYDNHEYKAISRSFSDKFVKFDKDITEK